MAFVETIKQSCLMKYRTGLATQAGSGAAASKQERGKAGAVRRQGAGGMASPGREKGLTVVAAERKEGQASPRAEEPPSTAPAGSRWRSLVGAHGCVGARGRAWARTPAHWGKRRFLCWK